MLRLTAPLIAALLASSCGGAEPPAPAAKAPIEKPVVPPAPPPKLEPAAPGAEDPRCSAAAVYLNAIRGASQLSALRGAYLDTALQQLIQASDAATARQDDAAISKALATAEPTAEPAASVTAEYAIHGALAQWMRHNLKVAAEDKDASKRAAAWTAARCVWAQDLRRLADLSPGTAKEEAAEAVATIDAAYLAGAAAVTAAPLDERTLLPARQAIEKTWYRLVHRQLAAAATRARDDKDPLAARRALGLFDMLRDRLQDKNTPGIALVSARLGGDPAAIDPAQISREVDVALVKRARKYCSDALDAKLLATPAGIASAQEGLSYTEVLLPGMRAALAARKFDADAHMATWKAFKEAVEAGDDADELKKLSDELVHWNCAYQQALGIRECTATADEK